MLLHVVFLGHNLTLEKYSKKGDDRERGCIFMVVRSLFLLSSRLGWMRFLSSVLSKHPGQISTTSVCPYLFFSIQGLYHTSWHLILVQKSISRLFKNGGPVGHGELLLNSEPLNFLTRHQGCCQTTGNTGLKNQA